MKDCCKQTYLDTMEDLIDHIQKVNHKSFVHLIATLKHVVFMVKESKEKEKISIIYNEWYDK